MPGLGDGTKLSYFSSFSNKVDTEYWWLRTPYSQQYPSNIMSVNYQGQVGEQTVQSYYYGYRTAFILPSTFPVIQNPDGTYSPAA